MAGHRIHGRVAGKDICRALGIDPTHVRGVTLRAFVDEALIVTIERYVTDDELVEITQQVEARRFEEPRPGTGGYVDVTHLASTTQEYLLEPEP